MSRTTTDWLGVLTECGVRDATAARWAPVFARVITDASFDRGDTELGDFMGQILHESAKLERVEEGLSYSAERLMAVWPSRFPIITEANIYARNPEALANKVYGGRLGNTNPGDGYRFRGRGLLQVTGRDNYRSVGRSMGVDLEAHPELLSDPDIALGASVAWWAGNIPDSAVGDLVKITKRVNGGTTGLAARSELTNEAREALA